MNLFFLVYLPDREFVTKLFTEKKHNLFCKVSKHYQWNSSRQPKPMLATRMHKKCCSVTRENAVVEINDKRFRSAFRFSKNECLHDRYLCWPLSLLPSPTDKFETISSRLVSIGAKFLLAAPLVNCSSAFVKLFSLSFESIRNDKAQLHTES